MKSGILAVVLAGLVVVAGIAYAFLYEDEAANSLEERPKVSGEATPAVTVHVDDLANKPESYKGEIVLQAVVARLGKSKGVFAAIDYREFKNCSELGCAKNYLPVKYDGEIPKPESLIQMKGQVVKRENGLVFEAEKLDVIE